MQYNVRLLKNSYEQPGNFSLARIIREIKLNLQLHYWGLHIAMDGQKPVPVKLLGKDSSNKAPARDTYEIDLYKTHSCGIKVGSFLSGLKRKFAVGGVSLVAFAALLGLQAREARAVSYKAKTTPPVTQKRIESEVPVIPEYDFTPFAVESILQGRQRNPLKLAYHNNYAPYHTNTSWEDTGGGHQNETWTNSIAGSHSNSVSDEHTDTGAGGHVNAPSGDLESEYLY